MKMLRKTIDRESIENFPKNAYDWVCFNNIANLHFTDCNPTITLIYHMLFSEYVSKNCILGSTRTFPNISEKFLRNIFVIIFQTKLQAFNV